MYIVKEGAREDEKSLKRIRIKSRRRRRRQWRAENARPGAGAGGRAGGRSRGHAFIHSAVHHSLRHSGKLGDARILPGKGVPIRMVIKANRVTTNNHLQSREKRLVRGCEIFHPGPA